MATISFDIVFEKMMRDPETKAAYNALKPEFERFERDLETKRILKQIKQRKKTPSRLAKIGLIKNKKGQICFGF